MESITKEDFHTALSLEARDFEDALQYSCAISCNCDVIVTRDKRDYRFDGIEVLTPTEFIAQYEN